MLTLANTANTVALVYYSEHFRREGPRENYSQKLCGGFLHIIRTFE